jgi:hypothetical protein
MLVKGDKYKKVKRQELAGLLKVTEEREAQRGKWLKATVII